MAITNLTTLEAAIIDWVARTELTTAAVDNFINIAEYEIQHGLYDETGRVIVPGLRCKSMQTHDTAFSLSGEYTTLPTGFLGFRTVKLVASPNISLEYVTPAVFDATYLSTNNTSTAQVYTIVGDELRVGPGASAADDLDIVYYTAIPNLVANATNWLCTKYPHAYLYGALRHLAVYTGMDSRVAFFQSAFIAALAGIHSSEKSTEFSGTALMTRTLGVSST